MNPPIWWFHIIIDLRTPKVHNRMKLSFVLWSTERTTKFVPLLFITKKEEKRESLQSFRVCQLNSLFTTYLLSVECFCLRHTEFDSSNSELSVRVVCDRVAIGFATNFDRCQAPNAPEKCVFFLFVLPASCEYAETIKVARNLSARDLLWKNLEMQCAICLLLVSFFLRPLLCSLPVFFVSGIEHRNRIEAQQ